MALPFLREREMKCFFFFSLNFGVHGRKALNTCYCDRNCALVFKELQMPFAFLVKPDNYMLVIFGYVIGVICAFIQCHEICTVWLA